MKKALSVAAAVLIFLFSAAGCEKQMIGEKTPPPLPESFSANVEAVYNTTAITAHFIQKSQDEYSVEILSPEILTPLTVNFKGGICTLNYDGLDFKSDFSRFPQTEFGKLLIQAISDIKADIDIAKTYSDGIWSYSGSGERGVFVLTRDAETGAFLEFEIEGAPLHIVFKDFKTE